MGGIKSRIFAGPGPSSAGSLLAASATELMPNVAQRPLSARSVQLIPQGGPSVFSFVQYD